MHKTSLGAYTGLDLLTLSRLDDLFLTLKIFWAICRVRNDMRQQSSNCKLYFTSLILLNMYYCKKSWPKPIKHMYMNCEGQKLSFKGL